MKRPITQILRVAGWGALGLFALVLAALSAAALYLRSGPGERWLATEITRRLNGELRGRLELGKAELAPGLIVLTDLSLYDPQGVQVARIARLTARVELAGLLRHRVHLEELNLEEGALLLANSPAGLNLSQALQARAPLPQKPPAKPKGRPWRAQVEKLRVSDFSLEYRSFPNTGAALALRRIALQGSGRISSNESALALAGEGEIAIPVVRPFSVDLKAAGGSATSATEPLAVERLAMNIGASRLLLRGEARAGQIRADIEELALAREDLLAVAPRAPIVRDLSATGSVEYGGERVQAILAIPVALGRIEVTAAAGLAPFAVTARVETQRLDLAALLEKTPETSLNAHSRVHFHAGGPSPGTGHLELELAPSSVRGVPIESARAVADLRGEVLTVQSLSAILPGARIEAGGDMSQRKVDLRMDLGLASLEAFSAAVARMTASQAPRIAGQGSLALHAAGRPEALKVSGQGNLERLEVGNFQAQGLRVAGELPNASKPLVFHLRAQADRGQVSDLPFERLEASIAADRRTFSADLSTRGSAAGALRLRGEVDRDRRGARVDELVLGVGGARWGLAQPVALDLRDGFRVDRLVLISGPQVLEIEGGLRRSRLKVAAQARQIDLAALPRLLVPPSLELAGRVDLEAQVGGTLKVPTGEMVVSASGLGLRQYRNVDLTATVALSGERRTSGKATVAWRGARGEAVFDLPLSFRSVPEESPLAARIEVEQAPLAELGQLLGEPSLEEGVGALNFELTGTSNHPRAKIDVRARSVRWPGAPIADVDLSAELAEASKAHLDLSVRPSGSLVADARAGISLNQLLSSPSTEELARIPLELAASLSDVAWESRSGSSSLRGVLGGRMEMAGSLGEPRIDLAGALANIELGDQPVGELRLDASYIERKADARLSFAPLTEGRGSASFTGSIEADLGLEALERGPDFATAPIYARLDAQEIDLGLLGAILPLRQLGGVLEGSARLGGTLGAPVFQGMLSLREGRALVPGYGAWSGIRFDLQVNDRRSALLSLQAQSGGGELALVARARREEPSTPYQVTAKLLLDRVPLTVGDQLIAFLSGETEQWTGEIQGMKMTFDLRPGRLVVELPQVSGKDLQPLEPNPDIIVVTEKEQKHAVLPAAGQELNLRINAQAPGELWVQSTDIKIEAGADVHLQVEGGNAKLRGEVSSLQGRAEVLGRMFDLRRGRLVWRDDPLTNPRLDVVAGYENPREQVQVKVAVSGTARKPKIDLSSEPPLDETEIATLLATGRRELRRGASGVASGTGAASVVGNFMADRLRRVIATKLPLDVLQVELAEPGPQTLTPSTKVEAGTYVTDKIYVGYRRNFGANIERGENANEVRVDYQLSRHLSAETNYGDALKGGANVVYSRDY
jgi:translocation and assembly module TamB